MIPISLKLRGFRGIKAGLGLDEISLDLSALPDGIVAICGENGRGKTTILDNLHPYRIMPYKLRKAKDWSPGAFSFYDHTFGSDAMKELVFEMSGDRYKSIVLIDADRKKQEAYLYIEASPVGWQPLNDGKNRTYDDAIEQVCGSPTLFFSSVFRAQGAKNLSDYTRGDIMSILSELLNIDHITEQGKKCRDVVSELRSRADIIRASVRSAQADVDAAAGLEDRIRVLDREVITFRSHIKTFEEKQAAALATISRCQIERASRESDLARLNQLKTQLSDEATRHQKEMTRLRTDSDRALADHAKFTADCTTKSVDLCHRLERAKKITSSAEQIREAVAKEPGITSRIADVVKRIVEAQETLTVGQKNAADADKRVAVASSNLKAATANVAKLDGIDCRADGSGWINSQCRFVSSAAADRDAIPALTETADAAAIALAEVTDAVLGYKRDLDHFSKDRDALQAEQAELLKFVKLLPELESAESSIIMWESDLSVIEASLQNAEVNHELRMAELRAATNDEETAYTETSRRLSADIDSIPVYNNLSGDLEHATIEAEIAAKRITETQAGIRGCELEIAGHRATLAAVVDKRQLVATADEQIASLNESIADFALLAKACGASGGIASLEVDDSGPTIASIANELLASCYGSRFSLRMDTQAEKADGSMKEAIDFLVFDSETDSERSISDLSGGQNSWINDALTRAICLFNIGRSGKVYGTLFADEVDGALDHGKKLEFFAVKRKALELGSHSREFFISQTSDLIDMADARIVLEPGCININ